MERMPRNMVAVFIAVAAITATYLPLHTQAQTVCPGWEVQQNGTAVFTDISDACAGGSLRFNYFQQEQFVATVPNVTTNCSNVVEIQMVNVSLGNLSRLENVTVNQSVTQCREMSSVVCTCAPGTYFWAMQGIAGPQECCIQSCPQATTNFRCGTYLCNAHAGIQCSRFCCSTCSRYLNVLVPVTRLQNVTRPRYELQPRSVTVLRCRNVTTMINVTQTRVTTNSNNCQRATYHNVTLQRPCVHGQCSAVVNPPSCVCAAGWTGGGTSGGDCSTDANECANFPCMGSCTNTNGSFYCSCIGGFQLASNNRDCIDVDECATATVPVCTAADRTDSATCTNRPGSFTCACAAGYTLSPTNSRLCLPGSCGTITPPSYCPAATTPGVTCRAPQIQCEGANVGHSCTFSCPDIAYVLEGPITGNENSADNTFRTFQVPCTTSLTWGGYSRAWCRFFNRAPTDIRMSGGTLPENSVPILVGILATVDPDVVERFTYRITAGSSWFELRGAELWSTVSQDYETAQFRRVTIASTDKGNVTIERTFTVTVLDRNDAPTAVRLLAGGSIPENATAGTAFAAVQAVDPDRQDRHTFEVLSPAAHFRMSGTLIIYRGADPAFLDYEEVNFTTLTVRCVDSGGLRATSQITIGIADSNDAPVIETQNFVVEENLARGATAGTLNVSDQDMLQNRPWLLARPPQQLLSRIVSGSGQLLFSMRGLQLIAQTGLDYEVTPSLLVRVQVTDSGSPMLSSAADVAILIRNTDEAPVLIRLVGSVVNETVPESTSGIGTIVGLVEVYDEDLASPMSIAPYVSPPQLFSVGSVSCRTIQGSASMPPELRTRYGDGTNRRLQLCSAPLQIAAPVLYSAGARQSVLLNVSGQTTATPAAFTVTVRNVNQHPTAVLLSSTEISENTARGVLVAELSGVDPDPGNAFSYTAVPQPNNATAIPFAISGSEMIVAIPELLNYEVHQWFAFQIAVRDGGSPSLVSAFAVNITVMDVNEPPTALLLSNTTFPEDLPVGGVVASVTVVDPDFGQTHNCTLTDPSQTFTIGADSVIRLAAQTIDFERRPTYSEVALTCTDSGLPPLSLQQMITLTVRNVNEAPTDISVSATAVRENLAAGTLVGTLTTTDGDSAGVGGTAQSAYVYSFATRRGSCGADATCPFLVDTGGNIRTTAVLDYESSSEYNMTVTSTDPTGLSVTKALVVSVLNVNDPPSNVFVSPSTLREGIAGLLVGRLAVIDHDRGQTHTLALVDREENDGNMFVLDGTDLRLSPTVAADYELSGGNLTIRVRATDNGNPLPLFIERDLIITVVDINEAPTLVTFVSATGPLTLFNSTVVSVPEDTQAGTTLATLRIFDPDNIGVGAASPQTHTCVALPINQQTSAVFAITQPTNYVVLASGSLNFETATYEVISIRCTDSGSPPLSIETSLLVRVTGVNEPPSALALNETVLNFATGRASINVPENLGNDTVLGELHALDPDNCGLPQCFPHQQVQLTISLGGEFFRASSTTASRYALIASRPFDFETAQYHALRIVALDNGVPQAGAQFDITVAVLNMNDPPFLQISGFAGTVAENDVAGTVLGQLQVIDQDDAATPAGQHTVSIVSQVGVNVAGSAISALGIDAQNRLIVVNSAALRVSPVIFVAIHAVDHGTPSRVGRLELTIHISPENFPPQFLPAPPGQILAFENTSIGAVIATFGVQDPDMGQAVNCSATVTSCFPSTATCALGVNVFAVDGTSTLRNITLLQILDFELVSLYTVSLRCDDSGVPVRSVSQSLQVTVVDCNDLPTDVRVQSETGGTDLSVREDAPQGFSIGRIVVVDEDAGQTHTLSLGYPVNETSRPFAISGRFLIVSAPEQLDFETHSSYSLGLTAIDSGVPSASVTVTIVVSVINVNERPTTIDFSCGCRGSPCLHGGSCGSSPGSLAYTCGCILGYSGSRCEVGPSGALSQLLPQTGCLVLGARTPTNSALLRFVTIDPDVTQNHTLTIVRSTGSAAAHFAIHENSLVLQSSIRPALVGIAGVSVTVRSTDSGNLFVERIFRFALSACGGNTCDPQHGVCAEDATVPVGYNCSCTSGYVGNGRSCTLSDCGGAPCLLRMCAATPCENGGTCTDGLGADGFPQFTCSCTPGFRGQRCETSDTECQDPLVCSGAPGALCRQVVTALANFSCQCPPGRSGARCQYLDSACAAAPCLQTSDVCMPQIGSRQCIPQEAAVTIGFTFTSCVSINATTITGCDGRWDLTLHDVENFVSWAGFSTPTYAVFAMTFQAARGSTTEATSHFVVWNNTNARVVPIDTVLATLSTSCTSASVSSPLGLCNFSVPRGSERGTASPTDSWTGGGLFPLPSPPPQGGDDVVDVQDTSVSGNKSDSSSVSVLAGAIVAAVALLLVGGMVIVKRRSERLGTGSISGPSMAFTNPTFQKRIQTEHDSASLQQNARIATTPSAIAANHGYLDMDGTADIVAEANGYIDVMATDGASRQGTLSEPRRSSKYVYTRSGSHSNPVFDRGAARTPGTAGAVAQSPTTNALGRTVRSGTWTKSAALAATNDGDE